MYYRNSSLLHASELDLLNHTKMAYKGNAALYGLVMTSHLAISTESVPLYAWGNLKESFSDRLGQ